MMHDFFVTAPRGTESLLTGELRELGLRDLRPARAGVAFRGSLTDAYRACLWSRLASRVILSLAEGAAADAAQLYETASRIDWDEHLSVADTLAVDFTGVNPALRDTRFAAVRVKDAIVDQFRSRYGDRRPSVDTASPDIRVSAHLVRNRVTLGVDLSGDSLHRRGYRREKIQVAAPLKENLAAAVLRFANWPREAEASASFLDPLCGSATIPIEAAWMAGDVAPGLLRAERDAGFGFGRWRGHDEATWRVLLAEARERRVAGLTRLAAKEALVIRGSDHDAVALRIADDSVTRAGLRGIVTLERGDLEAIRPASIAGLLATNAPYGARLGGQDEADELYRVLGHRLRELFGGWHAAILAGDQRQIELLGIAPKRSTPLRNGPLPCTLAFFALDQSSARRPRSPRAEARSAPGATQARSMSIPAPSPGNVVPNSATSPRILNSGAEHFANRLRKNRRHLARQVRREDLVCYRLYDADLPEFNFVIDIYGPWVHLQEYAAPTEIDPVKSRRRLEEAVEIAASVLDVPVDHVVLKQRRRQRGAEQYERRATRGASTTTTEDGLTYLVNLTDYLDTGFFVDQRLTRRTVRQLAGGRRFLNLFAYTGTMTANALAGGAPASTSVDLSATYLEWAQRNLAANGFSAALLPEGEAHSQSVAHELIQADCLRWITETEHQYDLIWLDPPTFSNSKRMGQATFDVQRDHADLLRLVTRRLLAPGGILLFATNRRGFKLERSHLGDLHVKDLSRATLPFDCARAANRHHVFRIEADNRTR
ncbi:MAG: bifunctional 23S rRNA (guanine(2069)-N(7))-methyltransferase RlmK/23S rRNA (guanine(2445)-N(2))-methyltransferase RlmL [Thermoleophilia bacterium]